jgi:hypothetical protein
MKRPRRTVWGKCKLIVKHWWGKLEVPKWSAFGPISNSLAARATILIPLIGYLIIFNEYVIKYLNLVGELGGAHDPTFSVSPRLLLVYFGLCAIAVGVVLYSRFCPNGVKHYGSPNAYVGGVQGSVKRLALREFEVALENSDEYRPYYADVSERFSRSIDTIPSPENWAEYINGILHLYYRQQNKTYPSVRVMVLILYVIGFCCLSLPSLGVFYRVSRILWSVASTQFGLLF